MAHALGFAELAEGGSLDSDVVASSLQAQAGGHPAALVQARRQLRDMVDDVEEGQRDLYRLAARAVGAAFAWTDPSGQPVGGPNPRVVRADWYPDPAGDAQLRYWDGRRWSGHVATAGTQYESPL